MGNKLKDIYTYVFEKIIKKHTVTNTNSIFVLCGITAQRKNLRDSLIKHKF